MKRILSVILSLLMLLTFIPVMTSCNGDKNDDNTLSFFRPALNPADETDHFVIAINEYKKKHGVDVEIVQGDWNNWTTKIVTRISANRPIDVIFNGATWFNTSYTNGYFEPLDKYVDLKNEALAIDEMNNVYSKGGMHYLAVSKVSVFNWVVIYNKTMFENNNVTTPREFYEDGNWTTDNFIDIAKKMTQDTNDDGEADIYGMASWTASAFVWSNNATFLNLKDGIFTDNFSSDKLATGLEISQKAANAGIWSGGEAANMSNFYAQKFAMYIERSYNETPLSQDNLDGKIPFEYDMIPFPYGPDNTEKLNLNESDGYGIGKGSKKAKEAGVFIDEFITSIYNQGMEKRDYWRDGVNEEVMGWITHAYSPSAIDSPLIGSGTVDQILNTVNNTSGGINSTLASFKPTLKDILKKANEADMIQYAEEFEAIGPVVFKNNSLEVFKNIETNTYEYVTDSDFADQALKITTDGSGLLLQTDCTKAPVVGRRRYTVTFDYKLTEQTIADGSANGYFIVNLYDTQSDKVYGRSNCEITKDNMTGSASILVDNVDIDSSSLELVIKADGFKDVIINNISVTEYEYK